MNEYINKRVLLKLGNSTYARNAGIDEYKILEISPSNNFVKLMNIYGNKFWKPMAEIAIVEVLKELPKYPIEG